jgi:hypothetical protein
MLALQQRVSTQQIPGHPQYLLLLALCQLLLWVRWTPVSAMSGVWLPARPLQVAKVCVCVCGTYRGGNSWALLGTMCICTLTYMHAGPHLEAFNRAVAS